jgi:ABC-type sugar transport system ATPase subunit
MSLLTVSGINLQEEGNFVLIDISFTQKESQKIVIAGETGSGKSTLLQVIAGFVQPTAGEVRFEDVRVKGPQEKLVPGHAGIAYLSQQFELPQFLRVEQVLQYANALPKEDAENLYEVCQISHLLKRKTNQLSGGERQRVAIARLLGSEPSLFLLDEPFSNLDMAHKNTLKAVIRNLGEELDINLILVSHDPLDTLSWADEILVMQNGGIIQQGTPQQIYRQPLSEYVAGLFGGYNLISSVQAGLFTKFLGENSKGKDLLFRPEDLKITKEPGKGIPGEVKQLKYFGSYYEIEILIGKVCVVLKTGEGNFKVKDHVFVNPDIESAWYF